MNRREFFGMLGRLSAACGLSRVVPATPVTMSNSEFWQTWLRHMNRKGIVSQNEARRLSGLSPVVAQTRLLPEPGAMLPIRLGMKVVKSVAYCDASGNWHVEYVYRKETP